MSFVNQIIHAFSELPVLPPATPVTQYLPKDITADTTYAASLFIPYASGHITMPSSMHFSFYPFPAFGLLYTSQGTGTLTCGTASYNLTAGCLVLFDARKGLSFASTSPKLEYDLLYFGGAPASFFYNEVEQLNGLFLASVSLAGLNAYLRPLLPGNAQEKPFSFHRLMTGLLTELIEHSSSPKSKLQTPSYLTEIRDYLDNNYFKAISLTSLEALFHINKYRICREFKEYYFMPPLQYVHIARINKAKDLLSETTLKIHEIGYQVGYENTNQFISQFKKLTGSTPAIYRKWR